MVFGLVIIGFCYRGCLVVCGTYLIFYSIFWLGLLVIEWYGERL